MGGTQRMSRSRARLTGAAVGSAFGAAALAASLLLGDPADWSRGLGWLVLVLAPPIGAALGPRSVEPGLRPAVTSALIATGLALPAGAYLYVLALGLTTGHGGVELAVGALVTAAAGVVIGGIPLGLLTFAAASLAVAVVRLVVFGPAGALASYTSSKSSQAAG